MNKDWKEHMIKKHSLELLYYAGKQGNEIDSLFEDIEKHMTQKEQGWEESMAVSRIWRSVAEELSKRGIKYGIGDAYACALKVKNTFSQEIHSARTQRNEELRGEIEKLIIDENRKGSGNWEQGVKDVLALIEKDA